jgi:DNA mismatch repair protein MutS
VVARARTLLKELESGTVQQVQPVQADDQISMMDMDAISIRDKLAAITVETLTPIEAMNALYELKQMIQE